MLQQDDSTTYETKYNGMTPISLAASYGHKGVCKILSNIDPNYYIYDSIFPMLLIKPYPYHEINIDRG